MVNASVPLMNKGRMKRPLNKRPCFLHRIVFRHWATLEQPAVYFDGKFEAMGYIPATMIGSLTEPFNVATLQYNFDIFMLSSAA